MKVKTQADVTVPLSTFTLVSEIMKQKPVTEAVASKLKVVLLVFLVSS